VQDESTLDPITTTDQAALVDFDLTPARRRAMLRAGTPCFGCGSDRLSLASDVRTEESETVDEHRVVCDHCAAITYRERRTSVPPPRAQASSRT
jgi:hypothetical protein